MLESIVRFWKEIFNKYIWIPMLEGTGYNPVNTMFVAAFLVIFSWISYKILKVMKFDKELCISIIPYVAMGSLLRAMKDHGIIDSLLFITPWIWILLWIPGILILRFGKKEWLTFVGIVGFLLLLPLYKFSHLGRLFQFLVVFQASLYLSRILAILGEFRKNMFYLVAHLFDASTTFVAVSNGFFEQHVLARAMISLVGPVGIFLIKIPILYLIFRLVENEDSRDFLLFIVFLVATGPGLRNLLTMIY